MAKEPSIPNRPRITCVTCTKAITYKMNIRMYTYILKLRRIKFVEELNLILSKFIHVSYTELLCATWIGGPIFCAASSSVPLRHTSNIVCALIVYHLENSKNFHCQSLQCIPKFSIFNIDEVSSRRFWTGSRIGRTKKAAHLWGRNDLLCITC